jgi:hypothetical protein
MRAALDAVRAWQQRGRPGVDKPSTPATTAENMKPSGGARDDVSAGAHAAAAAAPGSVRTRSLSALLADE